MKDFAQLFGGPLRKVEVMSPICPVGKSSGKTITSSLKLLSWNLLAPPYNRRCGQHETLSQSAWRSRALEQISLVAEANADVIGLQEFWVADNNFCGLWRDFADSQGYQMHVVPRVDGKQDGLAMLIRLPGATCTFSAFTFNDWGSRVLQVAELQVHGQQLVLMQTHLTFPHASAHDPPMRRQQARKIAEYVRQTDVPLCLFGDLNGDVSDPAVQVCCG